MGGVLANLSESASSVVGSFSPPANPRAYASNLFYDPTNGTVSFGDLYRVGGNTTGGYGRNFYDAAERNR
jgi:hypothetical protein